MRTLLPRLAGLVAAAAAAGPAWAGDSLRHDITVDARGPLAFVEITRGLPAPDKPGATEALLDVALPEQSALVAVEVRDRGRWRSIEPAAGRRARRRLPQRERGARRHPGGRAVR